MAAARNADCKQIKQLTENMDEDLNITVKKGGYFGEGEKSEMGIYLFLI